MSTLKANTVEAADLNADLNLQGNGTGDVNIAGAVAIPGVITNPTKQSAFIPAAGLIARTTDGAEIGSVETVTNLIMIETKDFDTATTEYVQVVVQMPNSWDAGTVTAQFNWSHDATTTNFGVAFGIQAVAFVNDDAADTAFGTAVVTVDTGGTTDDIYQSAISGAVTIANSPAKNDFVVFQIYRDVADGGDNMANDARLHGVTIHYNVDTTTDAQNK